MLAKKPPPEGGAHGFCEKTVLELGGSKVSGGPSEQVAHPDEDAFKGSLQNAVVVPSPSEGVDSEKPDPDITFVASSEYEEISPGFWATGEAFECHNHDMEETAYEEEQDGATVAGSSID